MKKIGLFLNSIPYSGGTFQYNQAIIEAINYLSKKEYSVVIAYTSDFWKKYLQNYNFKLIKISNNIFLRGICKMFKINGRCIIPNKINPYIKKMYEENCDLWIFPSQDSQSYKFGLPSLSTIHDLMHRYEGQFPEVSANGEYKKRDKHYKHMCKYVKGILVDSSIGKSHVVESYGVLEDKVYELPYIPPQYIYEHKNKSNYTACDKFGLPDKYIFYPAQFWKHKNHYNLIKAIDLLKDDVQDISAVFVGSKKNGYEQVEELIKELKLSDRIKILGYVDYEEMVSLYKNARALVMPTFFGPTNIPQLEAFVLGCPVATSNIYGIPEQVEDAALLFNPNSIEEISNCIKMLWHDEELCNRLVAKGYKKSEEWNQIKFNERLHEIIKQLV